MDWRLFPCSTVLGEYPGVPDPTGHLVAAQVWYWASWHPLPQLSWYFNPAMVGRPHWLPSSQVLDRFLVVLRQVVVFFQPSQLYSAHCESWEVPRNTEDLKAKLLRPESAVEAVWPAML